MKSNNPKYQTLHAHTTTSDGHMTHEELLNACRKYGVSVVAFTDHDALPNAIALKKLDKLRPHNTKWVVGIEISTGAPKENGGGPSGGVHMVGLFVDPENKALLEYCEKSQAARVERMEQIVSNLQKLGFHITADDCLKFSKGEVVARPHIRDALLAKEHNLKVITVLADKLKMVAEHDERWAKEHQVMIDQGLQQYPFSLFLKEDSFIPGVYVEKKYWVDLDGAVRLIREAGGIASLAHYTFSKKYVGPELLERLFVEDRIDGAETVYGLPLLRTAQESEAREDEKLVGDLAQKYGKLTTGGVDAHAEADLKLFVDTPTYAERTVGMVEKVLAKVRDKVNLSWSTIG